MLPPPPGGPHPQRGAPSDGHFADIGTPTRGCPSSELELGFQPTPTTERTDVIPYNIFLSTRSGPQALAAYLHLQLALYFFVDLRQFFLGDLLSGPSDDQTALVGLLRFGDNVEMDVKNDLGNHTSTKDSECRRQRSSHLVSNFSVILVG